MKFCLDVHTHFFNASDVNVQGYLAGPVAHSIRDERARKFVEHMSPVVDELAGIAPRAWQEYQFLSEQMSVTRSLAPIGRNPLDDEADKYRDSLAPTIFREMTKRNLDTEYRNLEREQAEVRGVLGAVRSTPEFSEETVRQAIDPVLRNQRRNFTYRGNLGATQLSVDGPGVLEFVGHMLPYRWMALRSYQRHYTEDNDAFGIDGVFSALVDFDYYLACPARSSREDQVKLHSLLSLASGGYLLPLVGYNPWTDLALQDTSFELVKRAVLDYGFIGVKIYPPIGYLPYGNGDTSNTQTISLPKPDPVKVDEKLKALFTWCANEGVPVMAHTGESMGRDDPSDENSKPEAWKDLLAQFVGRRPPIINAGHFGGDAPKSLDSPTDWPAEFAAIAATTEGSNLFGDLGYWSALQHCASNSADCVAALRRLKRALDTNPAMVDRLMFGTDWLMLSKEPAWDEYPRDLAKQLKALVPPEKFFYTNAMACFGLSNGGAQQEKILRILREISGGAPAWLVSA